MAKTLMIGLLLLSGCATPRVVYKEVKIPVPVPCQAQEPQVFPLPVEDFDELTVQDYIRKGKYNELGYKLGSSLVLLNGDVEAFREVLGACQ